MWFIFRNIKYLSMFFVALLTFTMKIPKQCLGKECNCFLPWPLKFSVTVPLNNPQTVVLTPCLWVQRGMDHRHAHQIQNPLQEWRPDLHCNGHTLHVHSSDSGAAWDPVGVGPSWHEGSRRMGVHIADSSLTHAIQVSNTKQSKGHGRQLQENFVTRIITSSVGQQRWRPLPRIFCSPNDDNVHFSHAIKPVFSGTNIKQHWVITETYSAPKTLASCVTKRNCVMWNWNQK